jgi:hypothetical protein
MKTKSFGRFFAITLLICSLMAFVCINFGSRMPNIVQERLGVHKDTTAVRVQILPDVTFFKSVWKGGSRILPKIVFIPSL